MTLEQFTQWLNGAAPRFITARAHDGQLVTINRDAIVSVRQQEGRLMIHHGFGDDSAPVFFNVNPG